MGDSILISIFFIVDGAVLIALGVPLFRGQVSPNSWYGFRTRKTLADEKVWYTVNRLAGRDMMLAGAVIIAASLLLLIFGISFERTVAAVLTVTLLSLGWIVVHGYLVLRRM